MFKVIKLAIGLGVALVIFNYFGLLNPQASKEVDKGVNYLKLAVSEIAYDGKPIEDLTIGDLAASANKVMKGNIVKEGIATAGIIKENVAFETKKEDKKLIAELTFDSSEASTAIANKIFKQVTGNSFSEKDLSQIKKLKNVKFIMIFDKETQKLSYSIQPA